MLTKPQSTRHAASRLHAEKLHAEHRAEQAAIKDRMRTCVAQDRFEALGLDSLEAPFPAELPQEAELLADRLLLLEAVSESSEIIRAGLELCQRITNVLSETGSRPPLQVATV
jgi:hypothetical protein